MTLTEGQTEETFIRDVLDPYLRGRAADFFLHAILVQTKRINTGHAWRGGITKYRHFKDQAERLLNDTSAKLVTSVIDLYHLPKDFPGAAESTRFPFRKRVAHLENCLKADLGYEHFVPYISTHEFEALVLSSPEILTEVLGASTSRVGAFSRTLARFSSPEHINEGDPPSLRIQASFPDYDKIRHGPLCTTKIGLATIRARCEHFDSWVRRLEAELVV